MTRRTGASRCRCASVAATTDVSQAPKAEKRESRAPAKKAAAGAEDAKAGSIGELIKQKLGLQLGLEKEKKDAEKKAEETE